MKVEKSIELYKNIYYSTIVPRAALIFKLLKEKNPNFFQNFFAIHNKAELELQHNISINNDVKEQVDRLAMIYGFKVPTPASSMLNFEENQNLQNSLQSSENHSPDQRGRFNSLESIKTVKKYISSGEGGCEEEEKLVSETAILS